MKLLSKVFLHLVGLYIGATATTCSPSNTTTMVQLSCDEGFHFEILRSLATASSGGSDIGEVLTAAYKITPGDFESYTAAYTELADHVLAQGKALDARKYPVSVRDTMFRAAMYYQSADFYLHGNQSDPRILSLWEKLQGAFNVSLSLLPVPGRRVNIQADGFYVPCIYYKAAADNTPRPTLVIGGGYDGGQEEVYHQVGYAALQRGWNVISYEGPGQASPRRYQSLSFIPEWEKVVTPVVDYITTLPEVDLDALALVGVSFGGWLAPRAAAFEHRFTAVVALDGIYDFGPSTLQSLPSEFQVAFKAGNATLFNALINKVRETPSVSSKFRWSIDQGLWSWDTTSPFEWMTALQNYTLAPVIDKIKGPVFVGDAQNDLFFSNSGEVLAKHLGDRAYYYQFKTAYGDGSHAGVGAYSLQNQIVMDWLKQKFQSRACQV
ncbi:dipeptidyl aminopeptidase/acylaminoacyl peptidase [Talaromyces proteolyticus]|uniref:Dipeptidyl aminopeptidase/acylaminoacyl peptidase n=1 Tax=Talaromyces proteolyticus TaxID=1131652 RepID=A0AAD4KSZ0_9EURO|nr:dipeptidyl aminopeptidase/acylaminoacyl peptidase [Talaromyces proteolyticus]KAH8695270.1 dipeptidyl aminopeptidase/acylaminoacyl peptidase [Talaromyces proteolyticus]